MVVGGASLILVAGLAAAMLVAELTMAPPRHELVTLAAYLSVTGSAAAFVGWVFLGSARIGRRLGLRAKAFVAAALGGLMGLFNVLVIARLMFVSTSHDLWVLVAAVAFSVAVMAVFAIFFASSMAERVNLISWAVRSLASADGEPPEASDADEITGLARDVESLAARLRAAEIERERADQERRSLTAAVSHDLRTPVASLRAMAEALSAGVLDTEGDRRLYIEQIQRETERLGRMIDDLFDLAQIDAGALRLNLDALQIEEIVTDVVAGMQPQARKKGIALTLSFKERSLPCSLLDGALIERVVANLLRNAIEHTPSGGRIEVAIRPDGAWLILSVRDTGAGFDPAQTDLLWQRFYRLDTARGRSTSAGDGAGLGLSIVRGFVEAHGGQVSAVSNPGMGSTFTVRLPVAS
jgi:signal transduction histidine kinase